MEEGARVTSVDVELYAAYQQFYLEDEAAAPDQDEIWDGRALERHLGSSTGRIAVGTTSDATVPVRLEVLSAEPENDASRHDHVVDASVLVRSGYLVLVEWPDRVLVRVPVSRASYRVRVAWDGLHPADHRPPGDRCRVQVWPAALLHEPYVLHWYAGWQPRSAPANPSGRRMLVGAEAWDNKNRMQVLGLLSSPAGAPTPHFLYYDQRDGSYWDHGYTAELPLQPFLREITREEAERRFAPWPGSTRPT